MKQIEATHFPIESCVFLSMKGLIMSSIFIINVVHASSVHLRLNDIPVSCMF